MGNKTGKSSLSGLRKTNKSRSSLIISSIEEINLETFLLVWLDPNVDTSNENKMNIICLRKILTSLITFDNVESCEKWLKKCDPNEKMILIVSGAYGEQIVPQIHYLPSIISIFVYCLDVNGNKPWAKNYSKIRSVVSSTNKLFKELSMNQTKLESVEDSKALQIYSFDMKTASYIWYQLLLEILFTSDYLSSTTTFDKLLQILREYSSNDEYGLNLISEFEQSYQSKQAVSWLIRDTPLVRFINKTLREQDINMIFPLRFLLVDIHNQLREHHADSLNVFRLQPMLKSQMENLLANPGQLLIVNGFLFASTNMSELISNMHNNDQFETVLIQITAKYRPGVAPFAYLRDIDSKIEHQIDREILFMCGSIFVVGPLVHKNSIWTLQLALVSDSDVPELFVMKQQLKQNHNLCIIGDLLNHCKQSEKATIYYQRLLNELPKKHILITQINKQLSMMPKTNSGCLTNPQYILVNLSSHLTDFASAMLGTLCSLTSDAIYICNDELTINFSKWSDQSILLFTTAQFAASLYNLPKCFTVFTLENDKSKVNEQHQCATMEDLISQLADEIVRKYRLEAYEYTKTGELNKAKEREEKANQIYCELITIHQKFTANTTFKKTLDHIEPSLILLIPNNEDMDSIENYFGDFFSSYHFFHNEHHCHQHIVEHEKSNDIFLIIHSHYRQSITHNFRQFSNVKYVYFYGKSTNIKEKIFQNQKNLYYRLTYDLIGYYEALGDQYETNNQLEIARDIFLKGQKLCQFFSEKFPEIENFISV